MTAMESSYGIAVKNKFDLFLDDEADPLEILEMQEEAKKKKKEGSEKNKKDVKSKDNKSNKNKTKSNAPSSQQSEKPKIQEDKENRRDASDKPPRNKSRQGDNQQRDGGERGYRGPANRDRDLPPRRRENRDYRDRDQQGGGFGGFGGPSSPPSEYRGGDRPESGRGRGGGRGRGRGGRGGRFGKREFDRHSGSDKTGVRAQDKRDGGGAHNWGTFETDPVSPDTTDKEQMNTTGPGEAEDWAPTGEDAENKDPVEKTEGENEESEDKEGQIDQGVQEMTLDEYRALQSSKGSSAKTQFNIRKAGEGVDEKQWKKTYVLQKKTLESEEEDEEYESDDEDDHRQKKKTANNLIQITFSDTPRRGGRGRMAGGGRGGRGRGGGGGGFGRDRREGGRGRGRRDEQPTVNINDTADFPELH